MRRTDTTHTRVFQAATVTYFPATAFEPLTEAIRANKRWWEGVNLYGGTTMIRIASITDVHFVPTEAIEAAKADEDDAEWSANR
jgi:hypothetical protein